MSSKPSELLIAARDLLAERDWCQGSFDGKSQVVPAVDPASDRFCAEGALLAVSQEDDDVLADDALFYLEDAIDPSKLTHYWINAWNDEPGREKGEVLDAFDHAIKLALEDEA